MEDNTPERNALLIDSIRHIIQSMNDDDAISAITETDILIGTLTKEYIKENQHEELKNNCKTLLTKPTYNRLLRINQRLKQETDTAIEYYDEDIGEDPRLLYQQELEEILLATYSEIRKLISSIIKNQLKEDYEL